MTLLFSLLFLVAFLAGLLIIALTIKVKYGDHSACHELFAVRDKLIEANVFKGVPRDDPWLDTLYTGVNNLLRGSKLMAGPGEGWDTAARAGRHFANKPPKTGRFVLPSGTPSGPMKAIIDDLQHALAVHRRHHMGWAIFRSAHEREVLKIRRKMARELEESIKSKLATC